MSMIVLLTRKFAPQKGGMETFSNQLDALLPLPHRTIHFGARPRDIVWAAPRLLFAAWRLRREATAYHLGDGVLVALAPFIRWFSDAPIVVTIHALEVLYPSRLLQFFIRRGLPACDAVVAVSDFTKKLLVSEPWLVAAEKISVIPHGAEKQEVPVDVADYVQWKADQRKLMFFNNRMLHKTIKYTQKPEPFLFLLTVGRLVPRKGVAWFIRHVLPGIVAQHPNVFYVVVGVGPDQTAIEAAVNETGLKDSVIVVGSVDDSTLRYIYRSCDVFVMPNIPIANDAEGFGFVGIEAASFGLPVLATNADGIPTAIHDGKNGRLVEPKDAEAMTTQLTHWIEDDTERVRFGTASAQYTQQEFDWTQLMKRYADIFERLKS